MVEGRIQLTRGDGGVVPRSAQPGPAMKVPAPKQFFIAPKYREKRRGIRLNSRVPVAIEWQDGRGRTKRKEAYTRVVAPYGCLVVLPQNLEVEQKIQISNLANRLTNRAVVVWKGNERAEGWELGVELLDPQMDFWGLEL